MTENQIFTLVLYLAWVSLPLITSVFGVFVRALSGEHPPPWVATVSRWSLIFVFSSVVAMVFDRFALPHEEVRKQVIKFVGNPQLVRVAIFPLAAFIFYVLLTLASFFKEPEGNFRFRREVGGSFSWGLLLGFVLMVLACIYGNSPVEDGNQQGRRAAASAPVEIPTPSQSQATSSSRLDPQMVIDPVLREFGNLERSIMETLGSFTSETERKRSEDTVVSEGLNLPNYKKFREMIVGIANRSDLEPELVLAVIAVESRFNPDFRANDGGRGLMNVTAHMARQLGISDFLAPSSNVEAGCGVLKAQLDFFGKGNVEKALVAYHFGTDKVKNDPDILKHDETVRRYVDNVLKVRDSLAK